MVERLSYVPRKKLKVPVEKESRFYVSVHFFDNIGFSLIFEIDYVLDSYYFQLISDHVNKVNGLETK